MLNRKLRSTSEIAKAAIPALCVLVSVGFGQIAAAAGPGGAAARGGAGAQIGAGAGVPAAGIGIAGAAGVSAAAGTRANADAPAPNARALENANGKFIGERKFGLDRAEERMSEQGAEHRKTNKGAPAKQ